MVSWSSGNFDHLQCNAGSCSTTEDAFGEYIRWQWLCKDLGGAADVVEESWYPGSDGLVFRHVFYVS